MSIKTILARLAAIDAGDEPDDEERTELIGLLAGQMMDEALALAPGATPEDLVDWLHHCTFVAGDTIDGLLDEWRECVTPTEVPRGIAV
jgi:hypothetical protein